MSLQFRAVVLLLIGVAVSAISLVLGAPESVTNLAFLAAALAAGELVELRPNDRETPLPLSFAIMAVLATADPWQVIVVAASAETVARVLEGGGASILERGLKLAERLAEALVAGAGYQMAKGIGFRSGRATDLCALTVAALLPIAIGDLVEYARSRKVAPIGARGADLALVTSGILMAVGYDGIDGQGRLGLWGPILFSIPLVAAWYSFELLASTRKSFAQTVEALAAAPELGGLVREGHAKRVSELASEMGRVLNLSQGELEQLHTAALLHHLGAVCLDEPEEGFTLDPVEVATAGANMLRASEVLAPAGDVVAAEPLLHRPPGAAEPPAAALSGMILKVASAYDELTEGNDEHAVWAVEALYTGPGYVYDGRVLGALERVLERRGVLAVR